MRRPIRNQVLALAMVIAAGTACGQKSNSPGGSPPPSVGASASSPSAEQAAGEKALAVYHRYRSAYVTAAATADTTSTDLKKYAGGAALVQVQVALQRQRSDGIVMRGQPVSHAEVTQVTLGKPPRVVIEDCVDNTNWQPFRKATGKSAAPPSQATRFVITSTVEQYGDGRWLVSESTADRSRSC